MCYQAAAFIKFRVLFGQTTGNQRQFCLSLDRRHSGPEPRQDMNETRSTILHLRPRALAERCKQVSLAIQPQPCGCDADDGIGPSVKDDRATDRGWASGVAALPQPVTNNDHGRGARTVFFL